MVPPAAATLPPLPSWTRVPALLWIIHRRRLCCQPRLRLEIRKTGVARIVDAWNTILEHDKDIRVLGEAKPNEPMDQAYLPTVGHMMAIIYKTIDPERSGVLDDLERASGQVGLIGPFRKELNDFRGNRQQESCPTCLSG